MSITHYLESNKKCKSLHGAKYTTVYVICKIKNNFYVLTHKRSAVMTNPLQYCGPGGSIDLHKSETSYQAALRELKEETGFENPPDGYLFLSKDKNNNDMTNIANYVFFCTEEQIRNGVKGPLNQFSNEVDKTTTFADLKESIVLNGTYHCLMNIKSNLNHSNLFDLFNRNLKQIYFKYIKKF
jgi:hypothetical protein